ncbi:MAG TPA: acetobutylicum phosphotransbutyrylase [Clostridium sp.]|nr:acetobutylicum phosphotransbutyrylase [Clostridium sp.]
MKKIIFAALSLVWIMFIFFNSSRNGSVSHGISMKIANKISYIISRFINVKIGSVDFFIRKCAHGFEFMMLAIIIMISLNALLEDKKNILFLTLLSILIIAGLDETLQIFISGRTSKVTDVLIDFLGGVVGCIITYKFLLLKINLF